MFSTIARRSQPIMHIQKYFAAKQLLFGSQFPVVVVDAIWGYAFHLLLAESVEVFQLHVLVEVVWL